MANEWSLGLGALVTSEGTRFRVWAPRARSVAVQLGKREPLPMSRREGDVFEVMVPGAMPGTDYAYVLDGDRVRPDPVSRHQPQGVHGPSRIVDASAFAWTDQGWRGLPLEDYLLYELHVGTFTAEGTFESLLERIAYLKDLGVTAVELMPVAEFPGTRNWGYDGVHLYAPQSSYGGPGGLKTLVDACHAAGLAVILDVVYNHLGPEGNYLGEFGPFFSNRYRTPWGDALNFDGADSDGVRRHFIHNALYWITEFHVDGLRLDAIHGIFDGSARHLLEELRDAVDTQARRLGRIVNLIAESDLNDVRILTPPELGGYGLDAQWSDDFHHSLHTLLTGQTRGYFSDFGRMRHLGKAIAEGFVYDGVRSNHRRRRHGNSSERLPGKQLVIYTQTHDQVANACGGKRSAALMSPEAQKVGAAVLFCAPATPMLFMGQEHGQPAPFYYFTSHSDPALAEAVSAGRHAEYQDFSGDGAFPDPQHEATFLRSKVDWSALASVGPAAILAYYHALIRLRAEHACLRNGRKDLTRVSVDEARRWLVVERGDPEGGAALCVHNLGPEAQSIPVLGLEGRWSLALSSAAPEFGGPPDSPELATIETSEVELPLKGWSSVVYLRENSSL